MSHSLHDDGDDDDDYDYDYDSDVRGGAEVV